jgi:hypothetical protein
MWHYTLGAHIFQKSNINLRILGHRQLTSSKFHTEDPQILGAKAKLHTPWQPGARNSFTLEYYTYIYIYISYIYMYMCLYVYIHIYTYIYIQCTKMF